MTYLRGMNSHMTLVPASALITTTASLHTLLGIVILVFWLSIFPSYVFSDVFGFEDSTAYTFSTAVWLTATVGVVGTGLDAYTSYLLYREMGWDIQNPLLMAGIVLTILHILAAYGAALEENEQSSYTGSQ